MKTVVMRRSGKRLFLGDKRAALFVKMGIADEEVELVMKKPIPQESASDDESEESKPKRRRYRRRDMAAEDTNCCQQSSE